ncbi:MAG: glutamate--cysteine ligase [Pseudomonadota bacterium]
MYQLFDHRLSQLINRGQATCLQNGLKGLEKESLRMDEETGGIARTPHPKALGSALAHPDITTDYSEALLEFITPPFQDIRDTLKYLHELHQFTYQYLDDELLWATSMPCVLSGDNSIPIADYGTSNVGMMKHVYRRGLGHRYGRPMQVISGVHFNYSVPEVFWSIFQDIEADQRTMQDFISDKYFGLLRNIQRYGWIVLYLFGNSPALCKSLLGENAAQFDEFDPKTAYKPFATSLRMSDIGYQNKTPDQLHVSYNDIDEYVATLTKAIETPYPPYEEIGIEVDGEYRQLNANILQIENEYYAGARPKQITESGEKPTRALQRRGVRYVELRLLDIDAYSAIGVNESQLRFLEAFLIFCLLQESPPIDDEEGAAIYRNQSLVATQGRDPELHLETGAQNRSLPEWLNEILDKTQEICDCLDSETEQAFYTDALNAQRALVKDADSSPSAKMLAEMRETGEAFFYFAQRISQQHKDTFKSQTLDPTRNAALHAAAEKSLQRQADMEASDTLSFTDYLAQYFSR